MFEIGGGAGVLAVEVAAGREQLRSGDFPGPFIFLPIIPSFEATGEFLELDGLGLRIVLPAFGKRLLVVPDFVCRMRSVEEHEIRWDTGVRGEDAVGEPDDGMEIEVFEQFLFDAGADTVAEECTVRDDYSGSTAFVPVLTLPSPASGRGRARAFEFAHDQLQKQQGGFGGLLVFGKVAEDAAFFFAAEGRVGHDDIDPVLITDLSKGEA